MNRILRIFIWMSISFMGMVSGYAARGPVETGVRDELYLDSLAHRLNRSVEAQDWLSVVRLARQALTAPDSILSSYPNTYFIYDWYAGALNMLGKYESIPSIVDQGQRYAKSLFAPTKKEFYNMPITKTVALMVMNRWDEAEAVLAEMDSISRTQGNGIMSHEIDDLTDKLIEAKSTMDWRHDADRRVEGFYRIADSLLLESPESLEGKEKWNKFFRHIMSQLELYYFDIDDPADERYWSRLLACVIVYFNVVGDMMPEREKLAYDLILLRKNFLDYHSGLLHKIPARWQTVNDSLAPGELAVELTMCPDEFLLSGKDYQTPISIPIPDEIISRIEEYNLNDPASISEFYSDSSPLAGLIDLLAPYLTDIHTLYISPTNLFAQFNYGAIPFRDARLDDYFDVVQLTTTADIGCVKSRPEVPSIRQALLYGGIEYGDSMQQCSQGISSGPELIQEIAESRRGYTYLPHTLKEVEAIAAILDNAEVYVGKDASEQRFKAVDWPRVEGILHIATHGYSLPSLTPTAETDALSRITSVRLRSGLLLAGANLSLSGGCTGEEDGILTSREIASLDMGNVELAVLSACSSGMGDLGNTTGVVYGVANAMKSAGAKRILATLWDIPDEASAVAMQSFYRYLASGHSVADSLRLMRKDMMDSGFSDPYYWAAFVCIE